MDDVLRMIARKIATHGSGALTSHETLVWNIAVTISSMTPDPTGRVPHDARVVSWASAMAGFIAIGAHQAAGIVTSLVVELAHRAENKPLDKAANDASLLRLADLKARFREADREMSLWDALARLIDRVRTPGLPSNGLGRDERNKNGAHRETGGRQMKISVLVRGRALPGRPVQI